MPLLSSLPAPTSPLGAFPHSRERASHFAHFPSLPPPSKGFHRRVRARLGSTPSECKIRPPPPWIEFALDLHSETEAPMKTSPAESCSFFSRHDLVRFFSYIVFFFFSQYSPPPPRTPRGAFERNGIPPKVGLCVLHSVGISSIFRPSSVYALSLSNHRVRPVGSFVCHAPGLASCTPQALFSLPTKVPPP